MIEYIKKLYRFILPKKSLKSEDILDVKSQINNGILSFGLNNNDGILVHCLLPKLNTSDINHDTIAVEAEKFAEMLLCINEGLLKQEIINVLREQYDTEEDINQKLLIENVLNFWSLLYSHYKIEKKKTAKSANKMPLIRPMAVFSSKR